MNTETVLWSFVVDTKDYAGNFERELCAYVCGLADEFAHHVEEYFDSFNKECPDDPFEDLIDFRINDPGDDGIMIAPMDIVETPDSNGVCNSVRIFLTQEPTEEQFNLLVERAQKFCSLPKSKNKPHKPRPHLIHCRLVKEITTTINVKTV